MIIFIVTVISFLLEYLINLFSFDSFFVGLIIFSSMVLVQPYFKKNKNLYFMYCFLVGFLYDFFYTGIYFMDAGLFLLIGVLVDFINDITPNNLFVSLLELIVLICLYRVLSFIFLCINGVVIFDFMFLFRSIYSSILTNIIYGLILYLVLYLISSKFHIKRINQFLFSYCLLVIHLV